LRLLSKTSNTRLIYESYNLLALSLKELNNGKKSLEYFHLASKTIKDKLETENYPKAKIEKSPRIASHNKEGLRKNEKLYQEAIHSYNRALKTQEFKNKNHPQSYAMLLDILDIHK
jgi:hypothetical protein